MLKRQLSLTLGLFLTSQVIAGPQSVECSQTSPFEKNVQDLVEVVNEADECPAPSQTKRDSMCRQIGGRLPDEDEESDFVYLYEKTLWEISCAKPGIDSEEQASEKIKKMWNKYHKTLTCDIPGFDISNGNVLKYSIAKSFPDLVLDTVKTYDLNINFKDPVDGLTVLDYVQKKLKYYQQNPSAYSSHIRDLTKIYEILRSRGAKHAQEL